MEPALPACEAPAPGGAPQPCYNSQYWIPTCECAIQCDQAGWGGHGPLGFNSCLRKVAELPQGVTITYVHPNPGFVRARVRALEDTSS